jgi:hypothetical protein
VALISALGALLLITPLVLGLLSMSTFELLIARNLVEATQAFFAAEAGLDWAFHLLVTTPDWSALLPGPPTPVVTLVVPPDLVRATVTVRVGRAALATDLTVTSTGTVNRAQRTIMAVIRRDPARPQAFEGHTVVSWREE